MPEGGRDKHPLAGYKAATVRIRGRRLIELLIERLSEAGWCDPILVAGPSRVYGELPAGARVIDTDGTFGDNIRASLEALRVDHPGSSVAFVTCDILPEPAALRRLHADYRVRCPCDLWFPMVRAPERSENLGASAWKPAYRIVPEPGGAPVGILPGHLAIADPGALRLRFLYRLFDLAYRTRNRSIDKRRQVLVRGVLADMVYQDLRHVLRLRPPTLTWSVLRAALPAASLLREGTITRTGLEDALRKIFVKTRHRRRHPERRIHIPFVDELSLARDIDTEEEAREVDGHLAG